MTKERKLPFEITIGDRPEERHNIFSGESIILPADAVAVYDVTMMASINAERSGDPRIIKVLRKGLDWFRKHEPKAYMVLLD
jgi:hypothetical protein